MTKKHFIALADTLKRMEPVMCRTSNREAVARHDKWDDMVHGLAEFCQSQNPRFNRERWLAYIAGECGPNGGAR